MTAAPSVWDSPDLTNALGDRLADDLRQMVRTAEESAERSQQTDLGPSEIGKACTRCLARAVLGMKITRQFDDPWCRIIGTATHAWLDEAAAISNIRNNAGRWYPEVRVQPDVLLLPSGGSCDLYDSETCTVIDHKVVGDAPLKKYRLNGPGPQYRVQAHLYGKGYANAGHRVDNVAVAFWNRGGRLRDLYVWTEDYDEAFADEALTRYRTIREQALAIGPALLPLLPADPECWDCGGSKMSAEELAACTTQPNPAPAARKETS